MATYNIAKGKDKNLDDTHINMRLKDLHDDAPETITEQQLEKKDRVGNPEVLLEKLLDKARTGSAQVIIEKNLSDSKGLFGTKHRNDEASMGDINKLEEKRLAGNKTEDEKYEVASEIPKQLRWWEHLKKASSTNAIKTAARPREEGRDLDMADELGDVGKSFGRWNEMTGEDPEAEEGVLHETNIGDLDDQADELGAEDVVREERNSPRVFVTKNKEMTSPIPSVYMEMSFDPETFGNDEEAIKAAAIEKAIEARPNLRGKITVEDLSPIQDTGIDSTIKLRLLGDEYLQPAQEENDSPFVNVQSEEVDVGGTPMSVGRISLSPLAEGMDEETLVREAVDYIADQTGVEVPADSIQINLEKGEITFAVSSASSPDENDQLDVETPSPSSTDAPVDTDFGIDEAEQVPEVLTNPEPSLEQVAPEQTDIPLEENPLNQQASKLYNFPVTVAEKKDIDSKKN